MIPAAEVERLNRRTLAVLTVNAAALVRARPKLRAAAAQFLETQRVAARLLRGPLRPALVMAVRG